MLFMRIVMVGVSYDGGVWVGLEIVIDMIIVSVDFRICGIIMWV